MIKVSNSAWAFARDCFSVDLDVSWPNSTNSQIFGKFGGKPGRKNCRKIWWKNRPFSHKQIWRENFVQFGKFGCLAVSKFGRLAMSKFGRLAVSEFGRLAVCTLSKSGRLAESKFGRLAIKQIRRGKIVAENSENLAV